MNVLIVGAGAMGSLLGARLSKTKADVYLIDIDPLQVEAIRKSGLVVEELDGSRTLASLKIAEQPESIDASMDLIVVMVKAGATRRAVQSVRTLCHPETLFLTLQNGIGHGPVIAELVGDRHLLLGTTAQGAALLEPGRIRHGGRGPTYIGSWKGDQTSEALRVVDLFNEGGLETFYTEQIEQRVWHKLLINVGINAITALTDIPNGWIASQPNARAVAQRAVGEAVQVATRLGINLQEQALKRVVAVAEATAVNRSSMRQDLARRRITEIDVINGAIVRYGSEQGVDTPVNWVLTQLVNIIEQRQASEVKP